MNYKGKRVAVTGYGFLAGGLIKALIDMGAEVFINTGDLRDTLTFARVVEIEDGAVRYSRDSVRELNYTFSYVFHFASPSSQILFKRNPRYCIDVTLNSFLAISKQCKENGIKLIYPSTGLLSQGKTNEYASCKKMCEDIHLAEGMDAIGLRIFATYGPGEGHKRDYASVPYLFARDMVRGRGIEVYGNGT